MKKKLKNEEKVKKKKLKNEEKAKEWIKREEI